MIKRLGSRIHNWGLQLLEGTASVLMFPPVLIFCSVAWALAWMRGEDWCALDDDDLGGY